MSGLTDGLVRVDDGDVVEQELEEENDGEVQHLLEVWRRVDVCSHALVQGVQPLPLRLATATDQCSVNTSLRSPKPVPMSRVMLVSIQSCLALH